MRAEGLEPPSLAAPGPKPGVSASSTTPAAGPPERRADGREIVWSRTMAGADVAIEHPNRGKAASKVTRAIVLLLLLASAFLLTVITIAVRRWTRPLPADASGQASTVASTYDS